MFEKSKGYFKKVKVGFFSVINRIKYSIDDTKKKFQNLYQTNYNTGMYHLENGNLWDATLRFKIIKRFWPDKLEAQYQYAICLILQGMNEDAKQLLQDILKKNPQYEPAKELFEKLQNGETDKMVNDFKAKFNKIDENKK